MAKLAQLPDIGDRAEAAAADPHGVPRLRTRYYAFLSYSHQDKQVADWLHRELEKFRVPHALAGKLTANGVIPRRLTPIFRDEHDLSAGVDLAVEIEAALAASQFLIVLCSPTAATSRWTNLEIESFKRTRPEGCVLAAVVAGEPFASEIRGREKEECFPPALRYKYDRRGRPTAKRADPLAADFRNAGEGRRLACLKLIAGMLGVGLDELVQRETTRRHRRLAWLAAASLGGMAVTSTLAVTAIHARDFARDQRREAEGLVAFMLGDLKDKLEPIGRLDALDGVGAKVLAYYSKQDAGELSDAALVQRSRALSLTAQVAYLRGHLDDSQRLYRQALAGTAEAVRRSPDDTRRIFDHAQNVFWLGELARFQGRTDEAYADYREYKRLGDRLVSLEPDNLKWRMEALYGREDVGIALYNKRRFAEAINEFQSALAPMQTLVSIDPGNATYQKELSSVLAWVADAQRSNGNIDAAVAARTRQIALVNSAIAAQTSDVQFREQLIPAHQALGILLASRGSTDRAIEELKAAVTEAERLIPLEPANAVWKLLAASARLELAKTLLAVGRTTEAGKQATTGCAAAMEVGARKPAPAKARVLQTACLTIEARLAMESGANDRALALASKAIASARAQQSGDPVADRYSIASAYRLAGDIHRRTGDAQAATGAWLTALAQLPDRVTERPPEMSERAQILQRLGRADDAQPLTARLTQIGFRSVG